MSRERIIENKRSEVASLENQLDQSRRYNNELEQMDRAILEARQVAMRIFAEYREIKGVVLNPLVELANTIPDEELAHTNILREATANRVIEAFDSALGRISDEYINFQDASGKTILMYAIINGFYYGVEKLLSRGADVNILDNRGANALIYSSMMPHLRWTKVIAERTEDVNYKTPVTFADGSSALHLLMTSKQLFGSEVHEIKGITEEQSILIFVDAGETVSLESNCSFGLYCGVGEKGYTTNQDKILKITEYLVRTKGADINAQNSNGEVPFFIACKYGRCYIMNQLLNHYSNDIDFDLKDINGIGYMHYVAAVLNSNESLQWLLNKGLDINIISNFGTPLCIGSQHANIDSVRMLLDYGADINLVRADSGRTSLIVAAQEGRLEIVNELLNRNADIEIYDLQGATVLHHMAQIGRADIMDMLLKKTNKVDIITNKVEKVTPLYMASLNGHLELVKMLLDHGADINFVRSDNGFTVLSAAIFNKNIAVVNELLNRGVDTNILVQGFPPLHCAAQLGDIDIMEMILCKTGNIDTKSKNVVEGTALSMASSQGNSNAVKWLADRGADINIQCSNGWSPLVIALRNKHLEVVKTLLSLGASSEVVDVRGFTALHHAAEIGDVDIMRLLIGATNNIDIKSDNEVKVTPFYMAGLNGHLELIKILADKGADINSPHSIGNTPLFTALEKGYIEIAKELLHIGADPSYIHDNYTLLHLASELGDVELVALIVSKGIDVNVKNIHGTTPILWASEANKIDVVKFLFEQKADINIASKSGTPFAIAHGPNKDVVVISNDGGATAWHYASAKGSVEVMKFLQSINPDIIDLQMCDQSNQLTALWIASKLGHVNVVKWLAEERSNLNAIRQFDGRTALQEAVSNKQLECVRELLKNGADINKQDNNGFTPLHEALSAETIDPSLVQTLVSFNPDFNIADSTGKSPLVLAEQNFPESLAWFEHPENISLEGIDISLAGETHISSDIT